MKTVRAYEMAIRKSLRMQENYSKSMETAIRLAAGNLLAYNLSLRDLESLDKSYIPEATREGNIKLVPHPAFRVFKDASESLRKSLRELNLTLQTLDGATDDDPMDNLVKKVHNVG